MIPTISLVYSHAHFFSTISSYVYDHYSKMATRAWKEMAWLVPPFQESTNRMAWPLATVLKNSDWIRALAAVVWALTLVPGSSALRLAPLRFALRLLIRRTRRTRRKTRRARRRRTSTCLPTCKRTRLTKGETTNDNLQILMISLWRRNCAGLFS